MDVVTPEEARIAEEAGAVAVMALERVPADIRRNGGVARMSDPQARAAASPPPLLVCPCVPRPVCVAAAVWGPWRAPSAAAVPRRQGGQVRRGAVSARPRGRWPGTAIPCPLGSWDIDSCRRRQPERSLNLGLPTDALL